MADTPDAVLFQAVIDLLMESEGRVHAETAIAAAAALSGEAALAVAGHDLRAARPGQAVFSRKVNGLLFGDVEDPRQWPETSIWGLFRDLLPDFDIPSETIPPVGELAKNAAAHVYDGGPWPYLSLPDEHWPQRGSLGLAALLRPRAAEIAGSFGLSPELRMAGATLACLRLLGATRQVLPAAVGVRLALETVIGAAKTCPLERPDQQVDPSSFDRAVLAFE